MRLSIIVTVSVLLAAMAGNAQSVVLSLDSNPENRCEKSKQGAMWTLHNPPAPTNSQPSVVVVNLLRSDSSGNASRAVSYTLSSGQTVELECSQGKPTVSYQITSQQ
jgi:hypothetical protein